MKEKKNQKILGFSKTIFTITSYGMLESVSWNNKNGIVLFGYEPINNLQEDIAEEISKQYISIYDFIFPIDKDNSLNLLEFPSFSIYFNIEDEKYYIKDFNIGVNYLVLCIENENFIIKIFNNIILENSNDEEKKCGIKIFQINKNKDEIITIYK